MLARSPGGQRRLWQRTSYAYVELFGVPLDLGAEGAVPVVEVGCPILAYFGLLIAVVRLAAKLVMLTRCTCQQPEVRLLGLATGLI